MNEGFQRVALLNEVAEGGMTAVMLDDGKEIILVRAAGKVFALDIMCTHQEAWLDSGFFHPDSMEVECPLHEGRFDVRNGTATCPPPTEPIGTYEVVVEGDDILVGPVKS
jgi:nitrite reductase/ring-hydroxylating ferredoxin subunit